MLLENALFTLLDIGSKEAYIAALGLWEAAYTSKLNVRGNNRHRTFLDIAQRLKESEEGQPVEVLFFLRAAQRHLIAEGKSPKLKEKSPPEGLPPLPFLPNGLPEDVEVTKMGYRDLRSYRSIKALNLKNSLGMPNLNRSERCLLCASSSWEGIADFSFGSNSGGEENEWFRCKHCGIYIQMLRDFG